MFLGSFSWIVLFEFQRLLAGVIIGDHHEGFERTLLDTLLLLRVVSKNSREGF
jgi:hypothetical protein